MMISDFFFYLPHTYIAGVCLNGHNKAVFAIFFFVKLTKNANSSRPHFF